MSCISEKRNVLRSPAVTTACWVGTPRTRQRRRFLCGPSIWPDFSYLHAVLWKSLLFPRPARATSERSTGDHASTHAGQPSRPVPVGIRCAAGCFTLKPLVDQSGVPVARIIPSGPGWLQRLLLQSAPCGNSLHSSLDVNLGLA